jgi:hypothetical protein
MGKPTFFTESQRLAAIGLLLLLPAFLLVGLSRVLQLSSTNLLIHPVVILVGPKVANVSPAAR